MEVLRAPRLVVATTAYLLSTSLLLLLISSGTHVTEAQKLQQYCKFTPQHTLCKSTGLGKACGQKVPVRGVPEKDAAVIVAQHNQLRARVALGQETKGAPGPQPKAANMLQMAWDEELSLIAQRHTDQCIFEHECADCRQVERFGVGQNLFISFQSDMDPVVHWSRAMQAWYDEVELFTKSGVDSYNFDPSTGHYTALMWSSTNLVGCGFTMYEEGGWYKKLYTCNYGPTGNIIFAAMYQRGEPCSSCPEGTSCSLAYPGLCAKNLPNSATNFLAPLIATTTPLPDFVFVDSSSDEDLVLLFPTPPGQGNSGRPGHSDFLADVDSSMALANAGLDGVNTLLLTNPDGETMTDQRENMHDFGIATDDYVGDYDYNFRDFDDDVGSRNMHTEKVLSQRRGRVTGNSRRNVQNCTKPRRDRRRRGGRKPNRKRHRSPRRRPTTNPPRRRESQSSSAALTDVRNQTDNANERRNSNRTFLSNQRRRSRPGRRSQIGNRTDTRRNNRRRNRDRSRERDDYYDNYDDYNSVEYFDDRDHSTEHDFDDYSDERSVEQWYVDDYDYNLNHNRNAELNLEADVNDTFGDLDVTTPENMEHETVTAPTMREILAEIFDTEELLRRLNVSDMTNVAALMTFFNNQELFRMTKAGRTHRQTFNRLVTELNVHENNTNLDLTLGDDLPTNASTEVDDETNTELNDVNVEETNSFLQLTTASNNNPKGIGGTSAVQSLGSPIQGGAQDRPNQGGGQGRPNQGNQNRPGNAGRRPQSAAKAVESSRPQPFQILQPFQLLPKSGLQVPSTLPPHPATVSVRTILENLQATGSQNQSPTTQIASTSLQNQQASPSHTPMVVLDGRNDQSEPPPNLPRIDNIQNFLMNFGKSSQVIRTNSLDSVKAIINSLPQDTHPLVFFRSSMGTIRQLNNMRIADGTATTASSAGSSAVKSASSSIGSSAPSSADPRAVGNRRPIRSTVTPAKQTLGMKEQFEELTMEANLENMLLSCQDVTAPCPVVALAGNWTHGREFQTNVVRTVLAPSMGGQLVLGQTIPPPESGAACVTLSHKLRTPGTGDSLPQVQVSVWPLGQVLLQEDLSEVSSLQEDAWLKTTVNFAPIRNPFMVVLSVEPNPGSREVEIALRGFMVTEGLC